MNCDEINYDSICAHIPHVIQTLFNPNILASTTLVEIRDAFRIHQMQGKAWLLDNIQHVDRNSKVLIIGSWLGFSSYCLYKEGFRNITETDPDSRLELMARYVNKENKSFKHLNNDVNDLDLSEYDVIINTSCEHISDNSWFDKIKPETIVVLQSTNLKCSDHVNTVDSLVHMKMKYPLNLSYADKLVFSPTFTRYMLIGQKVS
jgi:hypothetical protein